VIDAFQGGGVKPSNSSDATRIRYYTPRSAASRSASATRPTSSTINIGGNNGDLLAPTTVDVTDLIEGAAVYKGHHSAGCRPPGLSVVGSIAESR
jgi:hypothetical protein